MNLPNIRSIILKRIAPAIIQLREKGINALMVSTLTLVMSIIVGLLIVRFVNRNFIWLLLPITLIIRYVLDVAVLAMSRSAPPIQILYFEVVDLLTDIFLYMPFAYLAGAPAMWVYGFLLIIFVVKAAGIFGYLIRNKRFNRGPMNKQQRALVLGIAALFILFGAEAGAWLTWLMFALIVLCVVTLVRRFIVGAELSLED